MTDIKPRVVVAMSGGVDSSVAAGLLVEQGFRVVGMMLRLWSEEGHEAENRCCAPDAVQEARRIAGTLGIPFYVIDARDQFREVVVQDFLDGYGSGKTPNPCIVCNRKIRWGFLLEQALGVGGAYMATGHYARLSESSGGEVQLMRAVDRSKDQSYVLAGLNQEQLRQTLLPLGGMHKTEVRQRAQAMGLSVADKPDSQDLCFLGDGDYRDFLTRHAPHVVIPGDIVDRSGRVLGEHQGLPFYTIGQRKGLGIFAANPYYVLGKDIEGNRLVVGTEEELGQDRMRVEKINWINSHSEEGPFPAQVKIRYRASLAPAMVTLDQRDGAEVVFERPLRDITPGQQAVFYQGEICMGGGIIVG